MRVALDIAANNYLVNAPNWIEDKAHKIILNQTPLPHSLQLQHITVMYCYSWNLSLTVSHGTEHWNESQSEMSP